MRCRGSCGVCASAISRPRAGGKRARRGCERVAHPLPLSTPKPNRPRSERVIETPSELMIRTHDNPTWYRGVSCVELEGLGGLRGESVGHSLRSSELRRRQFRKRANGRGLHGFRVLCRCEVFGEGWISSTQTEDLANAVITGTVVPASS